MLDQKMMKLFSTFRRNIFDVTDHNIFTTHDIFTTHIMEVYISCDSCDIVTVPLEGLAIVSLG